MTDRSASKYWTSEQTPKAWVRLFSMPGTVWTQIRMYRTKVANHGPEEDYFSETYTLEVGLQ